MNTAAGAVGEYIPMRSVGTRISWVSVQALIIIYSRAGEIVFAAGIRRYKPFQAWNAGKKPLYFSHYNLYLRLPNRLAGLRT
jgi:hypothetical protein